MRKFKKEKIEIILRPEEKRDYQIVENLTREAFWNLYQPGCDEHFVLHNLRDSACFITELDYVAELNGLVVGNIVYSKGKVVADNGYEHQVIIFGPISVLPDHQGMGIGTKLIKHTLKIAKRLGFGAVIIFGNPRYYQLFGFKNAKEFGIRTSGGQNFDAFMAKALTRKGLDGISGRFFEDHVFHVNQEELRAFDQTFPPKKKEVTDTQLRHV